ncbi:topoisomerase DNA-binding C4 zinc finger domain-containing protein [Nitrosospira sp. Nsp11]|uniref:topoisomerase DNA-binding C4 zinc finger domain-containing protein n=1 Tax=Nitrosospira sp. Nsp11 TaxID=1855338 RepID=UPI002113D6C3|nr:topoisomerase DNA-binding C4 zinc finger domain-containing protein [Nitrosospira sp. Nsp11]
MDYRFLVRAALNVARAVGKVHQSHCVIGDLNHSGLLVSRDATIALIDADSFQFSLNDRVYHCEVGVPEFTPPELHGKSFANAKRTPVHDHFGLAVAIFHLLVMGRHPYAGRSPDGDLSLGEAIFQNRFAFSQIRKAATRMSPPPGSITLADFPEPIARAFEAAFGLNPVGRPDASTWVALLKEMGGGLRRCSTVRSHYYPPVASKCPWCRLALQSGVDMFPEPIVEGAPPPAGPPFDLDKIWAAIAAINLPSPEAILPKWTGNISTPGTAVAVAKKAQLRRKVVGILALAGAGYGLLNAPAAAIIWIGLGILGLGRFLGSSLDGEPFQSAYLSADQHVTQVAQAFLQRIGATELYALQNALYDQVAEYREFDENIDRELSTLKSTREICQKNAFLDRFTIRQAQIPGIGPAKTAMLASFGIETAADVTQQAVLAVPGFGEVMTTKMLAWRGGHENKFRYNATRSASDVQAENALKSRYAAKKRELQLKIRSGLAGLKVESSRLSARAAVADQTLMHALQAKAQAAHNLTSLGLTLPPTTSTFSTNLTQPQSKSQQLGASRNPGSGSRSASLPSCPQCGSPMQRRTARRGFRTGTQFWGCSRYPTCRGTRN